MEGERWLVAGGRWSGSGGEEGPTDHNMVNQGLLGSSSAVGTHEVVVVLHVELLQAPPPLVAQQRYLARKTRSSSQPSSSFHSKPARLPQQAAGHCRPPRHPTVLVSSDFQNRKNGCHRMVRALQAHPRPPLRSQTRLQWQCALNAFVVRQAYLFLCRLAPLSGWTFPGQQNSQSQTSSLFFEDP